MAVTVKPIELWRVEVENRPGVLANILQPLAQSGVDLQVLMGYRFPNDETRAAIEVYPITGRKATTAARDAGLSPSGIPTLLVEGDNRPGLGSVLGQALADAGINIAFVVTQVIGRKYSAVFGFASDADARRGSSVIKKSVSTRTRK
jgi:hypothetical protein